MTRLPMDDRNVVDRPDLPEYELNTTCAAPCCGQGWGLENHHLWRRQYAKSYWIELSDGTVVGNRVALCNRHHACVTVNNARILYDDGVFWWQYHGEESRHALTWQPPRWREEEVGAEADRDETGDPGPIAPSEGAPCPTCKRRIPHSKKSTTPKSQVWSTRVPVGDSSTFSEMVDAAAEHMGATSRPYHRYYTLTTGLALILQAPKEHLPNG